MARKNQDFVKYFKKNDETVSNDTGRGEKKSGTGKGKNASKAGEVQNRAASKDSDRKKKGLSKPGEDKRKAGFRFEEAGSRTVSKSRGFGDRGKAS